MIHLSALILPVHCSIPTVLLSPVFFQRYLTTCFFSFLFLFFSLSFSLPNAISIIHLSIFLSLLSLFSFFSAPHFYPPSLSLSLSLVRARITRLRGLWDKATGFIFCTTSYSLSFISPCALSSDTAPLPFSPHLSPLHPLSWVGWWYRMLWVLYYQPPHHPVTILTAQLISHSHHQMPPLYSSKAVCSATKSISSFFRLSFPPLLSSSHTISVIMLQHCKRDLSACYAKLCGSGGQKQQTTSYAQICCVIYIFTAGWS